MLSVMHWQGMVAMHAMQTLQAAMYPGCDCAAGGQ